MAKLPRYTAQGTDALRTPSQAKATGLRALTRTGEQEKFRAKGAVAAAVGDIGQTVGDVAEMIFKVDQKRIEIETGQQVKAFNTELEKRRFELYRDYEGTPVPSVEVRRKYHKDITIAEGDVFAKLKKDYTKEGTLNEAALAIIDRGRGADELSFTADAYGHFSKELHGYQVKNADGEVRELVEMGDAEDAKAREKYYRDLGLWGKEDGINLLDEAIHGKKARAILKEKDGSREKADSYVAALDIDTDVKNQLYSDIATESRALTEGQEKVMKEAMGYIVGDGTDPDFEPDFEAAKTLLIKNRHRYTSDWFTDSINKLQNADRIFNGTGVNIYTKTADPQAHLEMQQKVGKNPHPDLISEIDAGVPELWTFKNAEDMKATVEKSQKSDYDVWHDTVMMYRDQLKALYPPGSDTEELNRYNTQLGNWFKANKDADSATVEKAYQSIINPKVKEETKKWYEGWLDNFGRVGTVTEGGKLKGRKEPEEKDIKDMTDEELRAIIESK